MRQKNLCRSIKMFKISNMLHYMTVCSNEFLMLKWEAWVFDDEFCSYFIGCGFPNHYKSWIELQSNTVHYHFCILKSRKLLYICNLYSNLLESTRILFVFAAVEGRKKFLTRKVWGLCTPWSSILRPLKHLFVFPFHFKTQSSNFSVRNENKTLEVFRCFLQHSMITCTFQAHNFKKRTVFLGPLKSKICSESL